MEPQMEVEMELEQEESFYSDSDSSSDTETTFTIHNLSLAELIRPRTLRSYVGQSHVVPSVLKFLNLRYLPSMILHGPPGTGKTTLAAILAREAGYMFTEISATEGSLNTLKQLHQMLQHNNNNNNNNSNNSDDQLRVVVFIDEFHRFTIAQQDYLLPLVEAGEFVFIGATSANPGSRIRPAILSRCQVFELKPHSEVDLRHIISTATLHENIRRRLKGLSFITFDDDVCVRQLLSYSGGDSRKLVNCIELISANYQGQSHVYLGEYRPILVECSAVDRIISVLGGGTPRGNPGPVYRKLFRAMNHNWKSTQRVKYVSEYSRQMQVSDGENETDEEGENDANTTSSTNSSSLYYLLQLLHLGESPISIAKKLLIFTIIFAGDKSQVIKSVAAVKSLTTLQVDEVNLLSNCVERLCNVNKQFFPPEKLKIMTQFFSSPQPSIEKVIVEYDSQLVQQLLTPPPSMVTENQYGPEFPISYDNDNDNDNDNDINLGYPPESYESDDSITEIPSEPPFIVLSDS